MRTRLCGVMAVSLVFCAAGCGTREKPADREEEALVRLDPSLYHIWILLGLTHLERGEGGAAVERLTQALRLNPRSTAAATALAQARRLGG